MTEWLGVDHLHLSKDGTKGVKRIQMEALDSTAKVPKCHLWAVSFHLLFIQF